MNISLGRRGVPNIRKGGPSSRTGGLEICIPYPYISLQLDKSVRSKPWRIKGDPLHKDSLSYCWNEKLFWVKSNIKYYLSHENWMNRLLNIICWLRKYSILIWKYSNIWTYLWSEIVHHVHKKLTVSFFFNFSIKSCSNFKIRDSFGKLRTCRFQKCPWFWN